MSDDDRSKSVEAPPTERPPRNRILSFANFLARHERIFNVLSTTVTAIFTVVLATSTVFLWKETKDLRNFAQEQSADMKDSINEAARAATAMQNVATAVAANAQAAGESVVLFRDANVRQMRAYLVVGFGAVIQQDTATNYRFEVRLNLQNVGNTPAYKVESNTHLNVLPFPLPKDFVFPELNEAMTSPAVMMPHQSNILTVIADRAFIPTMRFTRFRSGLVNACMSTE